MSEQNTYFKEALGNFIHEAADGGAIRHMADLGMTVKEIQKELTFSMSEEALGRKVWERLLETGVIRLAEKENEEQYTVIREQTRYGKTTFRRVKKSEVTSEQKPADTEDEYLPCDFGIRLREDREAFLKELAGLSAGDRDYILGLPWSDQVVYHRADERIRRILKHCENDKSTI